MLKAYYITPSHLFFKPLQGVHTEFRENHQLLTVTYKACGSVCPVSSWTTLLTAFHLLLSLNLLRTPGLGTGCSLYRAALGTPGSFSHFVQMSKRVLNLPCPPCLDDPPVSPAPVSPAPVSHHPVRFLCCCLFHFAGISLCLLSHFPISPLEHKCLKL